MGKKPLSERERFLASVQKIPGGCWLWTQSLHPTGYGLFRCGSMSDGTRRRERAHRASYRLFVGPIPDGMDILHSCDVRRCVNPAHLRPGTAHENMQDARRKNRLAIGERHHGATLSDAEVADIKYGDMFGKPRTPRHAAKVYAISETVARKILNAYRWRHI